MELSKAQIIDMIKARYSAREAMVFFDGFRKGYRIGKKYDPLKENELDEIALRFSENYESEMKAMQDEIINAGKGEKGHVETIHRQQKVAEKLAD